FKVSPRTLPSWLVRELRSDHAGETGAIFIYKGILAVNRCEEIQNFALRHLETEQKHLQLFDEILGSRIKSRVLPLWRLAGFLTGAIPAIFGSQAVYHTIEAVEAFVKSHYQQQIERLKAEEIELSPSLMEIKRILEECQKDEINHLEESKEKLSEKVGFFARFWGHMVGFGSAAAVRIVRLI
ncbi:MAG: demethoxyubiquinone hydroxylase family protein, partial [Rhodospirillaceae bacterium]